MSSRPGDRPVEQAYAVLLEIRVPGCSGGFQIMRLDVESRAEPEKTRARYLFLEPYYVKP